MPQVLVLDTDVIFASDVAELWRMFDQLTGRKVRINMVVIFWILLLAHLYFLCNFSKGNCCYGMCPSVLSVVYGYVAAS